MTENRSFYYRMKNHFVIVFSILLVASFLLAVSCPAVNKPCSSVIAPLNAPFEMPELKPPTFPDRTVNIRDHGAVGDGATMNTKAIASAIAACAKAGGGKVLMPAGVWLTGPIHLKSNINLHIAEGAEVRFSTNFDDYLPVVFTRWEGIECYNYSPLIYANNCTNIAITGTGKLNGQGEAWWNWRMWQKTQLSDLRDAQHKGIPVKDRIYGTEKGALRPPLIQPINCRNVLIEGITATRSPFWVIHPVYCENLIVRKVSVFSHGVNNDAVDLDSCKNVLIEHCFFAVGDDAIAIKSGRDEDAWRVGRASENIVIRHCISKGGLGGVVIGSEMSGGVRNVFIHDVYFNGTTTGLRIKSKIGRGGVVENIWMQDIIMTDISAKPAFWLDALYASHKLMPRSEKLSKFRNIHIKNLSCWKSKKSIEINGYPEKFAENITLENVSISAEKGLILNNTKEVKLTKVNILPNKKGGSISPTMYLKDTQDVTIQNSRCFKGTDIFLRIEGKKSKNIQLINNDLSEAKKEVVLAEDVPPDAVVREAKKL